MEWLGFGLGGDAIGTRKLAPQLHTTVTFGDFRNVNLGTGVGPDHSIQGSFQCFTSLYCSRQQVRLAVFRYSFPHLRLARQKESRRRTSQWELRNPDMHVQNSPKNGEL